MATDEEITQTVSKIKGDTEICIRLPLPLDIIGTLGAVIGAVYPTARIATNHHDFTILIANDERARKPSKKELREAFRPSDNSKDEAVFQGFRTKNNELIAEFGLSQAASFQLASFCYDMLQMEGAANYVEFEARDKDNVRYWVAACRSQEQTPHHLRMKAEKRIIELEAEIERLKSGVEK